MKENLGCHRFSEDSYQSRHVSVYWPLVNRSTSYLMELSKSALKLDLLHPVKRMGICVEQNWAESPSTSTIKIVTKQKTADRYNHHHTSTLLYGNMLYVDKIRNKL